MSTSSSCEQRGICIEPSRMMWMSDDGHWQTKRDKFTDFDVPRICHSYNMQDPYAQFAI